MANDAWGQLGWNAGNFGQQNNVTQTVTGSQQNISQNSVDAYPNAGWGSDYWGIENWGESGLNITVTGNGLSISIDQGWGSLGWNSSEIGWGGNTVINTAIGQQVDVTGLQLNTLLNSVTEVITVDAFVTTAGLLGISVGDVDANPDANITGEQLNLSTGTLLGYNREGWGRYFWGEEVWGDNGTWETVSVTGQQLNISQGDEDVEIDVIVEVSAIAEVGWGVVGWGLDPWNESDIDITMAISQGEVDPDPDVAITGLQVNLTLNEVNITADSNLDLTGQQINLSLNSVTADANTIPTITGFGLTSAVGTVFAGGTSIIEVTGNALTITLNSINNQIWTEINTGTDATWIEIDTAA